VARGWGALGRAFPTFEATTLRREVAAAFSAHNTSGGRAWNAPIPAEVRAGIRTEVATSAFARMHGRAPRDDTEFTGFVATASTPAQTPVAGYDLTFSPVKSVSALWAIAPPEVATEVAAAHEAAVRATIGLLEREWRSRASARAASGRYRSPGSSPPRLTTATPAPATPTCTPTS
jgi:hypothetical protein